MAADPHRRPREICMSIFIEVNGARHEVAADPETPLLYVLRNDLGLKGARYGCGAGFCGACTVIVDGKAIQSCDVPVSAAALASVLSAGPYSEKMLESVNAAVAHDVSPDADVYHSAATKLHLAQTLALRAVESLARAPDVR